MIFYHGSKKEIKEIKYKGSSIDNDYGPSFYVTLENESAKEWACKNDEVGIVNKYFIRDNEFNNLKILDLTQKDKYSVLHWLAILMHFRKLDNSIKTTFENRLKWLEKYYIDVDNYDIIKGFRADDSYFKFPLKFISRLMSYETLLKVYKLGNLGVQYAFMSKKAIKKLKFVSTEQCDEEYIGRYFEIVKKGTTEFEQLTNKPLDDKETFIDDLMEQNE